MDGKRQAPAIGKLLRLFSRFSRGRRRLGYYCRVLVSYSPAAPPYVFWHLARFTKTLLCIEGLVEKGIRWLDVSSDPWFWLLARLEFDLADITPTSLNEEVIRFVGKEPLPTQEYVPCCLSIGPDLPVAVPGDRQYDMVTAFEVLEHFRFHPAPFLVFANKALRPGGHLVVSTPNVASWTTVNRLLDGAAPYGTSQFGGEMCHYKEYTPWEVKRLLETSGFVVRQIRTFDCYPNDPVGILSSLLRTACVAWHVLTLRPVRVRNLVLRSGSVMLVIATKVRECDPRHIARL